MLLIGPLWLACLLCDMNTLSVRRWETAGMVESVGEETRVSG